MDFNHFFRQLNANSGCPSCSGTSYRCHRSKGHHSRSHSVWAPDWHIDVENFSWDLSSFRKIYPSKWYLLINLHVFINTHIYIYISIWYSYGWYWYWHFSFSCTWSSFTFVFINHILRKDRQLIMSNDWWFQWLWNIFANREHNPK